MYGGNSNHMNKRKYMEAVGFRMWDIEDINVAPEERDVWGANDSIAMNRMLGLVQRTKQENGPGKPFFWACQTISSHEPWEVPYHRLDNKVHNAFAYTDHCVGQFLDSLSRTPIWDNLLVVVYADHGHTYGLTFDKPEFFHMPLFFVGGAVSKVHTCETIIAQNDIVATVLSQMGIPHNEEFPWSRNVFSRNYTYPFAFCNYPAARHDNYTRTGVEYKIKVMRSNELCARKIAQGSNDHAPVARIEGKSRLIKQKYVRTHRKHRRDRCKPLLPAAQPVHMFLCKR
jgi:phosphoglycerol transferase MdoB-like AlkP superfamily enzyme